MVLFQWQYQHFCPALGFSLHVSVVNFGVDGLSNAEQLVSPDHHLVHLKGVVDFHKSTIPLLFDELMVVSPHGLAAVTDPFQLSLRPEPALAETRGSLYPLLALLPGGSYGNLICVWTCDTVSRGCVHVRVGPILPWCIWVGGSLISSTS